MLDPSVPTRRGVEPAEVLEQHADGQHIRVRLSDPDPLDSFAADDAVWARLAINGTTPEVGSQVLVTGDEPNLYVIGCLNAPSPPVRLETHSGVCAEKTTNAAGHELIQIRSADNELLFEVDPVSGSTRVAIPKGRLEIVSEQGDLLLRSGGSIRMEGHSVDIRGRQSVSFSVTRAATAAATWIRLLPEKLQLRGRQFDVSAQQTDVQVQQATVRGKQLLAEAEHCEVRAEKIETVAKTVVQRFGNLYQTVRELAQHQVGRFRTYVSGTSHFRSKQAHFSSEETFHIDGDKVHLG